MVLQANLPGVVNRLKIGKSDLIDIDYIDQSVEIDDTLVSFIDLSIIYIGLVICRRPVFQDLDIAPFQNNVGVDPGAVTSRRTRSSQ